MRFGTALKSALLAACLSAPAAAFAIECERLIATGAVDHPPYIWQDPAQPGRLLGVNVELARQIAEALKVQLEILPSADAAAALAEVGSGRADLLLDGALLGEHLGRFDFVYPPIAQLELVAWVRTGQPLEYFSREDLAGLKGVRVSGQQFGEQFERFAAEQLSLTTTPSLDEALKAVGEGRVDYLLAERQATLARGAALGLTSELQILQPPVLAQTMHLAVGHDSACNEASLRGLLAIEMTRLQAAGVPQALLARNLELWLEQQRQSVPDLPVQPIEE